MHRIQIKYTFSMLLDYALQALAAKSSNNYLPITYQWGQINHIIVKNIITLPPLDRGKLRKNRTNK